MARTVLPDQHDPSVAFLVMAHTDPGHVTRLIERLRSPRSVTFLHLDSRVDPRPFETALRSDAAAHLLDQERRVQVQWGGFGAVEASRALLRAALEATPARTLVLISGADYPIKPINAICDILVTPLDFIQVDYVSEEGIPSDWDRRFSRRHLIDKPNLDLRSRWARGVDSAFGLATAKLPRRRPSLRFAGGPQWWALRRETAEAVLREVDTDEAWDSFFRSVYIPDESYFQTLVLSTTGGSSIPWMLGSRSRTGDELERSALHYIDWNHPNPTYPRVLCDESDFDALASSSALFARKFESRRSATLLDRIDSELLGG